MNLQEMTTDQLNSLLIEIKGEIFSRMEKWDIRSYSHACNAKGKWHLKQHKHWAKKIDTITDHWNGKAFEGEWLSMYEPNEVLQGEFILEFCGAHDTYRFFMVGAHHVVEGNKDNFVEFRNQCIDYFKNPQHAKYA